MRTPDFVPSCVAFLCVQAEDGTIRFGGTAFYVGIKSETGDHGWGYLITARHNIIAAEQYPDLLGRFNLTTGGVEHFVLPKSWMFPSNEASDVAVLRLDPRADVDLMCISERTTATAEVLAELNIGVGDEIVVTGLFSQHTGQERNVPIVRSGIIAAMPSEPLTDQQRGLPYHAYLVEMRSFGGLSGSPVFVQLNKGRIYGTGTRNFGFYLLGVMRGHWEYSGPVQFPLDEKASLNMGIAIVTPWADVAEILFSDDEKRWRREKDRERAVKQQTS